MLARAARPGLIFPRPPVVVAGAFNPASLFGGSDQGFLINTTDASTLYSDTARTSLATTTVGGITDLSGKSLHLSQSSTGRQPVRATVSSVNCITFDGLAYGSDSDRIVTNSAVTWAQPLTILMVAHIANTNGDILFGSDNTTGTPGIYWESALGGRIVPAAGSTFNGSTGVTASTWQVLLIEFNGASSATYRDGTGPVTGDPGSGGVSGVPFAIGGRLFGAGFAGSIAAFMAITRILTAGERASLTTWAGALVGKTI
jgi:hypothetical protein